MAALPPSSEQQAGCVTQGGVHRALTGWPDCATGRGARPPEPQPQSQPQPQLFGERSDRSRSRLASGIHSNSCMHSFTHTHPHRTGGQWDGMVGVQGLKNSNVVSDRHGRAQR